MIKKTFIFSLLVLSGLTCHADTERDLYFASIEAKADGCFETGNYGCAIDWYRYLMSDDDREDRHTVYYLRKIVLSASEYIDHVDEPEDVNFHTRMGWAATATEFFLKASDLDDLSMLEAMFRYHINEPSIALGMCPMHAVNLQRLKYLIENQDSWVERKLLGAEFKISEKYSDAFQDVETIPQFCDESR